MKIDDHLIFESFDKSRYYTFRNIRDSIEDPPRRILWGDDDHCTFSTGTSPFTSIFTFPVATDFILHKMLELGVVRHVSDPYRYIITSYEGDEEEANKWDDFVNWSSDCASNPPQCQKAYHRWIARNKAKQEDPEIADLYDL